MLSRSSVLSIQHKTFIPCSIRHLVLCRAMHGVQRNTLQAAQLDESGDRIVRLAAAAHAALECARTCLLSIDGDDKDIDGDDGALTNASSRTSRIETAMKASRAALEVNPDEYTLWNFRKRVLERGIGDTPGKREPGNKTQEMNSLDVWQDELRLTKVALQTHAKAYPAWQHRLWLLQQSKRVDAEMHTLWIKQERVLCEMLLAKDERNFHAWAHRANVKRLALQMKSELSSEPAAIPGCADEHGPDMIEQELEFSKQHILANFANYSAWHLRSVTLTKKVALLGGGAEHAEAVADIVEKELDWVRNAYYTDPDVESTWIYHRWLLEGELMERSSSVISSARRHGFLRAELTALNELVEMEPNAKWALLAKARLIRFLASEGQDTDSQQVQIILARLRELDPFRHGFYADLLSMQ
ncbi:Geranylgeranyl transferase type-2 subunit alpha [Porphyridium purpureum]|uniref:Geranylgeranyl transferase type-2 subunit alpha n=1 Tax=Porphyridium purpureum TaxID=35688 RepID=A0A5J4Z9P1_PORPP|nr:Geranylgeranyl transferase type-2 subunit alpha [Porphyridium purpureum]|eukprot:POR5228..scf295_1